MAARDEGAPDAPADAPAPEFPRPTVVETIVPGAVLTGVATAAERAALARRYGVASVEAMGFRAQAEPWGPGGWRVSGVAEARLTQGCVVTLEPVSSAVAEPFERFFAPPARLDDAAGLLDAEADEAPEPLERAIDVGEIAAEAVALAIDPYPRAPGAVFGGVVAAPPGVVPLTDEAARPFARLAALKARDDG